jgi:hypothetical protein
MWNEFANLVINDTSLFAICQKHMSTALTQHKTDAYKKYLEFKKRQQAGKTLFD